jgi:hypothetical protein
MPRFNFRLLRGAAGFACYIVGFISWIMGWAGYGFAFISFGLGCILLSIFIEPSLGTGLRRVLHELRRIIFHEALHQTIYR